MAATGKNYEVEVVLSPDYNKSEVNINKALQKINQESKNIKIGFDIDTAKLKSATEDSNKFKASFVDAQGRVATTTISTTDATKQYATSIKQATSNIQSATKATKSQTDVNNKVGYSWARAWEGAIKYSLVMGSLVGVKNIVRDMVESVTDLDSSLLELRKVTDLEGSSLDSFTKKAFKAGEGLAKTGQEVIQATTEFAKSGYDEDTSLELGKVALMYSNVADEEISAADSASFIIAQMKAFNIEAKDSIHIIDSVNEISNKYAVSSADLADNIGKASAALASGGTTYEESLGWT